MKIKSLLNKFSSKGFTLSKLLIVIAVLGVLTTIVLVGVDNQVEAITTKPLGSNLLSTRYRVTAADVIAGANPDVSGAIREITLFSLLGGDQVLTWVSNITTAFTLPSTTNSSGVSWVSVVAIRARQSGVDISPCDVAFPPALYFVNFEHRFGNCLEYAFYNENTPVDIVVTFQSNDGTNLNGLTAGEVDFLVSRIQ